MRLKNGNTPLEEARSLTLTAIYNLYFTDNYGGYTPSQADKVQAHIAKIHDGLMEKWGLNGLPLGKDD